jgi:hypothetical protein
MLMFPSSSCVTAALKDASFSLMWLFAPSCWIMTFMLALGKVYLIAGNTFEISMPRRKFLSMLTGFVSIVPAGD